MTRTSMIVIAMVAGCARNPAGNALDAAAPGDETDAGTDAGAGADAGAGPDAAVAAPFWSSEMTAGASDFYVRKQPEGSVDLGVADEDAHDGRLARLVFPGLPQLGNPDRVNPTYASELATRSDDFHYGVYRMRVKLASCRPGEEVVNGIFTYFNDGTDHDGDGVHDNSEIDVEVLCGTPHVLFLTVWTDYTFATETFRKWTRVIDLDTGDLWETVAADQHGIRKTGNDPSLRRPALLDPAGFLEVGFEWRADRVRYFATVDGAERTLVELRDPARVPQLPGHVMFNVWHAAEHWFGGGGPPDYPASDATMLVDWVRYWK